MKNVLLLTFLAFTMMACAKQEKTFLITPELQPYYDSYIAAAKSRGVNLNPDDLIMKVETIKQDSTEGTILAYCRRSFNQSLVGLSIVQVETPVVVVDKSFLDKATEINMEETSHHELTHCLMGQGHKNGYGYYTSSAGWRAWVPTSLMNMYSVSQQIGTRLYTELREAYLDEVFGLRSSALEESKVNSKIAGKAASLNSDQKVVFESVSTDNGCKDSLTIEHIDSTDPHVEKEETL